MGGLGTVLEADLSEGRQKLRQPVVKVAAERITFFIAPEVVADRLRDAAYWTPGETLSSLVERFITEGIRAHGEAGQAVSEAAA